MSHALHIVDVFAERRYTGNPLAVVVGQQALSDDTMLAIAAEMNYSETTFVSPVRERDGGHPIRIFTPAREIAFAGHPILGTASVLRRHLALDASAMLHLNIAVGQVPVTFEDANDGTSTAWFRAPAVTLGPTCARERMAAALGLWPDDIAADAPVQRLSAGTSAMIVPLRGLRALKRSMLDLQAYASLAEEGFPPLVYLFCRETHDPGSDLCARFFFEAHGVREDPATGNGAAFLGAYLLEHRYLFEPDFDLRIEQGHEVRRPSRILLRGRQVDGAPVVSVGGSVVATVRGELA